MRRTVVFVIVSAGIFCFAVSPVGAESFGNWGASTVPPASSESGNDFNGGSMEKSSAAMEKYFATQQFTDDQPQTYIPDTETQNALEGMITAGGTFDKEPVVNVMSIKDTIMNYIFGDRETSGSEGINNTAPEIISATVTILSDPVRTSGRSEYTPDINREIADDAASIALSKIAGNFDTQVLLGAADNYEIRFDGSGSTQFIEDDVGKSRATTISFCGPTTIDYYIDVRDQGNNAPDYMWLNSDETTLSVLCSSEETHTLVLNDRGEGIYTAQGDEAVQTIIFDAEGRISGIVNESGKGVLNLAFQNDLGKLFGNVHSSFWSFECNDEYGLSFQADSIGPGTLVLNESYGGVLGLVPATDPDLGALNTVHIKSDTIDFVYDNGIKQAEEFIRTDVEYWFGGDGVRVVPK